MFITENAKIVEKDGKKLVTDCTCVFDGCACDDIACEVVNNEIVTVYNACKVGTANFLPCRGAERFTTPLWRASKKEAFKPISWDEALDKAADILIKAKHPMLFGWSETSVEAIREGVRLTELVGGTIDGQVTHCHGPSVQAIQEVGYAGATLGEVKNRADLIIYWGCNPMNAHARHMSRYSTYVSGFFRRHGRQERKLVVVDPRHTDTAKLADVHIQIELGSDYEAFQTLRALIRGAAVTKEKVGGIPIAVWKQLAEDMKAASYGAIFFGLGLTHSASKKNSVAAAIGLTQDLCNITKFQIMPLRGHYNVAGLNQVLSWLTGYPYGVNFARGFPRYNIGEFTGVDMLRRKEVDAMLNIAADPGAHMPQKSVQHMAEIPLIACDIHPTPTTELANLIIPGTHDGIECEASCYRMDGIPIHLRKIVDPPEGCKPSNAHWLQELVQVVEKKLGEKHV
ncbi:MAG: formylmethanofuran dehydrogenase subunit B [Candidatus Lokiarchaeota archaeon]|nr:formylmethanofuran dehydrogenase subunit B [Candidatus Lokiarchaeota archaeon]